MNKIPTMFVRNPERMQEVLDRQTDGCAWVFAGEGTPTRKRDGTNIRVTIASGAVAHVEKRRNPTREEKAQGQEPGYVLANESDPQDKHIWAAVRATDVSAWPDGAWPCEALGPKIQGGHESSIAALYPFPFAPDVLPDCERTYDGIRAFLEAHAIEGIVWHHPDGRMAKIKRRDFGLPWPARDTET